LQKGAPKKMPSGLWSTPLVWKAVKSYNNNANGAKTTWAVPGGGMLADGIKFTFGKAPRDKWVRLQQIYVTGRQTSTVKPGTIAGKKVYPGGRSQPLVRQRGVTCSQNARDPHWKGDCTRLNNGQPGWGGGKGLHLEQNKGWVHYKFAAPKNVQKITVSQLGRPWTSQFMTIEILQPYTKDTWTTVMAYGGQHPAAQQNTVFNVPNGGVLASGVRLKFGKAIKDKWIRLQQVYILGQDTFTSKAAAAAASKPQKLVATGPTKQILSASARTTCTTHKRDPHWKGDCRKLNNGNPGWGGGKGLHVEQNVGWVAYRFSATRMVQEVKVDQLNNYQTKTFKIWLYQNGKWQLAKSYNNAKSAITTWKVPGGGKLADGIKFTFGKAPRDKWVRLRQIYVKGRETKRG
jgi:hypothetical protein